MVRILFLIGLLSFLLVHAGPSLSFETQGQDCSKCHKLSKEEARDLLKDLLPNINILDIRLSPTKALWEIFSESGGRKGLVYVDLSKKYLVLGNIFSIKEKKNFTQERMADLNKVDVSQIPLSDALVLGDPKAKIRLIAFDDPD